MSKPRVIAFYLPQFHPIPENDEWWGKGFTEWTNVAKAKPLFRGHYQPRIPADLGFYDLRVPDVRRQQAVLAREAGIEGFCYYHYWFGSKNKPKELMQMPFNEVVKTGEPDFPFCLCWANHSFMKRDYNASVSYWDSKVLVTQDYYGIEDYTEHFYSLLSAFKDKRYIKIDGKLLFVIYNTFTDIQCFAECWNKLAKDNGLAGFVFVNYNLTLEDVLPSCFDTRILSMKKALISNIHSNSKIDTIIRRFKRIVTLLSGVPMFKINYESAIAKLVPHASTNAVIPEILSGFDHSPRSGKNNLILYNFTPNNFKKHVHDIFSWLKKANGGFHNLVFLKSWNEWGESNYIEPDLRYGHGFINVLKEEIDSY